MLVQIKGSILNHDCLECFVRDSDVRLFLYHDFYNMVVHDWMFVFES